MPRRRAPRISGRRRVPGLAGDIVLLLVAAAIGVSVVSLAPSYPRPSWPGRPPQAELAVMDGQGLDPGGVAWQAVSPLTSSWGGAPVPGRMTGPWGRLRRWRATGTTMLFLHTRQRPDLVVLLRYGRLTRAGVPDGQPQRSSCATTSRCTQIRCIHHGVPGVCVLLDNRVYRQGSVVVVVMVRWRMARTEYASWGLVAQAPAAKDAKRPPRTGRA